jgi:hypothetical protein
MVISTVSLFAKMTKFCSCQRYVIVRFENRRFVLDRYFVVSTFCLSTFCTVHRRLMKKPEFKNLVTLVSFRVKIRIRNPSHKNWICQTLNIRGPQFFNFAKRELMMLRHGLQESKSKILCKLVHKLISKMKPKFC